MHSGNTKEGRKGQMVRSMRWWPFVLFLVMGCGTAVTPSTAQSGQERRTPRAITVGITSGVDAFSNQGGTTTTGGWVSLSESHSNALVTSDLQTRQPVPRLAEKLPSIDDGTISVLPDGRMRVVYGLRRDVLWHDGAPFTADDMVFSVRFNSDRGLPNPEGTASNLMESAEAPEPHTFVVYFKAPYYQANLLGIRIFWPQPEHVLGEPYKKYLATRSADELINLPYWTSQYVHTGPFRLTSLDPAGDIVFEAFDQYFLGRAKLDTLRVRIFPDDRVLMANLLAGAIDIVLDSTLPAEGGRELKERWDATGGGSVLAKTSGQRVVDPQWRSAYQAEPATFDIRVRQAFYLALDRPAIAEGTQAGQRQLAASELLTPGTILHAETRGTFDRYQYNLDRAKALMQEAGWAPGADGLLRSAADGRTFKTSVSVTAGREEGQAPVYADYWRRLGVDSDVRIVPPAFVRDRAYRAQYSGWEVSSAGGGDGVLRKIEAPAASAENRWTGNRDGYENPAVEGLLRRYYSTVADQERLHVLRAISDFWAEQLPLLVVLTNAQSLGVRTGVNALFDADGGAEGGQPYGTHSRNSHLWDVR